MVRLSRQHSKYVTYPLLFLASCAVAGCAVDQEKEVAKYRKVLDGTTAGMAIDYQPGETLTLERALLLANRDNERLAISGENYLQALIEKDRAAAAFFPTVGLEPSYTITDRASAGSGTAVGTIGGFRAVGSTLRRFEAPVVSRVNLFNGFGDVARLRGTRAEAERQRFLLLDQQALTLLDVAQVYFQVLRSERQVAVLESSLNVQEERVRDVSARQQAGLARPLDVSQTRAQMAATRVALVSARSDVVNGRTTLATLIAVPRVDGPLSYTFGEDLSATAPLAPVEAFEDKALTSREDVVAAQAAIRAAEQGVREAVAQYYPSVNLNLTGFLYRENFDDASKWTAVLNANLPIFTAGQIEADVRQAWSRLRQAALFELLVRRDALQGVRLAYENVTASRQRLSDLQTQVQAAREALEQAEGSYRVGLATNLERLTAQSDLLSAELQLTSERFDQALLLLDLTRFTGRLGNTGTSLRVSGTFAGATNTAGTGSTLGGAGFRTSNFIGNTSTSNGAAGNQ
jgi:outer membrane protein TolC